MIYAGGGVVNANASEELVEFVRSDRFPVTCTLMGLGAFPARRDPQWLGMLGMHGTRAANYAMDEADLICAVGARFDDRITGKLSEFAPRAKFIHIDVDPAEISKNVPAHIPIVGDAKHVLAKLLVEYRALGADPARLECVVEQHRRLAREVPARLRGHAPTARSSRSTWSRRCTRRPAARRSSPATSASTRCGPPSTTTSRRPGAGSTPAASARWASACPPRWAPPSAAPSALVCCIAGDGSVQMNAQELATCAQENIPIKVFIMNNGYLGMVRQWQELFWDGRYSQVDMGEFPDFVKLAEAYGATGMRLEDKRTLVEDMKRAIATDGPVLVDVRVTREENTYPMIPAGQAAREMVG